jgi:hypothetical protein
MANAQLGETDAIRVGRIPLAPCHVSSVVKHHYVPAMIVDLDSVPAVAIQLPLLDRAVLQVDPTPDALDLDQNLCVTSCIGRVVDQRFGHRGTQWT